MLKEGGQKYMDKSPVLLYKTQVVIIIILFVGVTFIPSIHANKDTEKGLPPDLAIINIYSYYRMDTYNGGLRLYFTPTILCISGEYNGILEVEGKVRRLFSAEPIITWGGGIICGLEKGDRFSFWQHGMLVENLPPFIYIISFKLLPEEQEIIKLNNELIELDFIAGSFNIRAILHFLRESLY